jgi:hypothetical protein
MEGTSQRNVREVIFMQTYNHRNELYHWGVKGMRWGVRRYQNKDGSLTPAGKKRYDSDADIHEDHTKASPKSVKSMSDKELREAINRIQMERQYAQLTSKEKSVGRKFVESLLTESGKEIAKSYITKYAKKGIELGISELVKKAKSQKG